LKRSELTDLLCIPSNYATVLLNIMESQGVGSGGLLSGTKIRRTVLAQPDGQIPYDQFNRLMENVDAKSTVAGLWLLYGKHLTLSTHGVLGHTIINCTNLSEVISVLQRYYKIQLPFLELSLENTATHSILTLEKNKYGLPELIRTPETLFASLATNLKLLLHQDEIPLSFEFKHPEPTYKDVYISILGENIRFDCGCCKVLVPNEILDLRSAFSNPAMKRMYELQCEQLLQSLKITADPVAQVKKYLLATPGTFPGCEEVAELLNVSVSTLRRRLNEYGTSFQTISDDVRATLAVQYLKTSELTVDEIANLTGFSDTSNFRRAFVKWTGRTPSTFRENK